MNHFQYFRDIPTALTNRFLDQRANQNRDVFFLTTTFQTLRGERQIPISVAFANFEQFYVRVLQLLIHQHRFNRRRHLQPEVWSFADFGSIVANDNAASSDVPHLHSIWTVDRQLSDKFAALGEAKQLHHAFRDLGGMNRTCDVKGPLTNESDIRSVVQYSTKYLSHLGTRIANRCDIEDLAYNVLPKFN